MIDLETILALAEKAKKAAPAKTRPRKTARTGLSIDQILAMAEKAKKAAPRKRSAPRAKTASKKAAPRKRSAPRAKTASKKAGLDIDRILELADEAKRKIKSKSTRKGKHAVMRDTLSLRDMRRDGQPVGLDLFAGAGGFGLGAERAGLEAVGVQRNPLAVKTARRAGLRTHELDVGELGGRGVAVDVLIGGPPCQPFSSAGRGRGQYDPREGFGIFLDVVDATKPRRLVAENVKAFLEPRHQSYYRHIMGELKKRYPYTGTWVLNAKDFGVPQDRVRVFIWASEDQPLRQPKKGAKPPSVAEALPHLAAAGYDAVMAFQGGARARSTRNPAPTLTTRRNLYAVAGTDWVYRGAGSVPSSKRRLLQPEETLVLQAFPEGFDVVGNKEQQQCQIGNAVPPPLAAAVVEAVTKGLKARKLTSSELLDAFSLMDETILVMEPRPFVDAALIGVVVDPPYLDGPGIIPVYDRLQYDALVHNAYIEDEAERRGIPMKEALRDPELVEDAWNMASDFLGSSGESHLVELAPTLLPTSLLKALEIDWRKWLESSNAQRKEIILQAVRQPTVAHQQMGYTRRQLREEDPENILQQIAAQLGYAHGI
jgi:DNA (cytosine-5)-methyltransferase 1